MTSLLTSLSGLVEGMVQSHLLITTLVKVSMIVATAGLINVILRRSSAAIRHWVWSLAFYSLFLLPFISQVIPGRSLQWLPRLTDDKQVQGKAFSALPSAALPEVPLVQKPISSDIHSRTGGQEITLAAAGSERLARQVPAANIWTVPRAWWIFAIWSAGTLLLLGRLGFELSSLWWLVRKGHRATAACWVKSLTDCKARLNLQRQVQLIFSDQITIPITFGLLRPVILLPHAARLWSQYEREIVLIHELEHVRRWDYVSNLAAQLVCAFYWVNPLVWIAEKWQRIERERACDDTVIGQGAESHAYASYLLDLAKSLPAKQRIHARAIAIAHNSELKKRLGHILSQRIKRSRLSRIFGLISVVVVVSVLVPLAGVHLEPKVRSLDLAKQPDTNSVKALIRLLQSGDANTQKLAAWALGEREDRKAVPPLVAALQDDHAEVRGMAAWALGEIKDRRAQRPLIAALSDTNPYPREMVVRALGELEDERATQPLIRMLADSEPNVRVATLWALEQIRDKKAFYAAVAMLNDRDLEVRRAALRCLRGIGCDPAFVAITASLKNRDPQVRATAAQVLAEFTDKPMAKLLPEVLYKYSPGGFRSFADLLPAFESKSATAYLIEALRDSAPFVRAAAAETLGKIGVEPAIEALISATQDPDSQVRAMAVWALDEINLP